MGDKPNPPYDHENSGDPLSGQWFAEEHVTKDGRQYETEADERIGLRDIDAR